MICYSIGEFGIVYKAHLLRDFSPLENVAVKTLKGLHTRVNESPIANNNYYLN